jgi:hypothetical protein
MQALRSFFNNYFEILAFGTGLLLLALMNPENATGPGFCILERMGASFCPGDGLGHSISYIFRGEFHNAMEANILGPFALIVLSGRILHLSIKNHHNSNINS